MSETKRYQMVFSEEMYNELLRIADKHHVTVEEAMRKGIKLLFLLEAREPGDITVTVNGEQRFLVLFET